MNCLCPQQQVRTRIIKGERVVPSIEIGQRPFMNLWIANVRNRLKVWTFARKMSWKQLAIARCYDAYSDCCDSFPRGWVPPDRRRVCVYIFINM